MISFLLNDKLVKTALPAGSLLLDFVRYQQRLTGTKIGCREGDCGACTVLVGSIMGDVVKYQSYTSCLTPLGNVDGKHVLTIEGVNNEESLNAVQQAMANASATQCGFCTPGFVMSLSALCLNDKPVTYASAIAAIDGNICRCTGYKSIERAAVTVSDLLRQRRDEDAVSFGIKHNFFPAYLKEVKTQLLNLQKQNSSPIEMPVFVGGGTDLYVQRPEEMHNAAVMFSAFKKASPAVWQEGNQCMISASATVTDLSESDIFKNYFPEFDKLLKLVSSTPIRNMATIAGNFINASPIGDFTVFFLSLNATLNLSNGTSKRQVALREFYKGYKQLDKNLGEYVEHIQFTVPDAPLLFNFEKICKRTHLDIASVNSSHVNLYE